MEYKEKINRILKSEIKDFAYFEDRRFLKSPSERHIFIRKLYLTSHYPEIAPNIRNYKSLDTPLSLSEETRELFISLIELQKILTIKTFNQLLQNLLTKAKGFDQINIVFDFLFLHKDYDGDTINFIINSANSNHEIRGSFQAQNVMPTMILNNIQLVDASLVLKFVSNFPKPNNLLTNELRNKYELTIETIKRSIKGKEKIKPTVRNTNLYSNRRNDWNAEIEAGEDELRKWDEEDPSWRVANDFD